MREPAPRRPSVTSVLAAGRVLALLVTLGLGPGGVALVGCETDPFGQDRQKDVHPAARWAHSAAVAKDKIYVIGGAGPDNQTVATVEVYDPATGMWARRASMPTPRALLGVGTVGGKIYAVGGTATGPDKLAVVEAYDPATDTWTRRADMPTARNALSTAVVEGKIYAIGGWGFDRPEGGWESLDPTVGAKDFSTVEIYDPETDTWTAGEDMPRPRNHMTVSALDGRIFVMGGGSQHGGLSAPVDVYDTATNRWTTAADMPTPRSVPSSSVVDGRIYVMGGIALHGQDSRSQEERMRNRTPLAIVEVYDPTNDRWATDADLTVPRGWFSTSVVDGKLYIVGGRSLAPEGAIVEVDGAIPELQVYAPTQ